MTHPQVTSSRIWTGDEWESHVRLLLMHHYGPSAYQDVPDRDGGDHGIEGFARDGTAFQCYSAEGILTTAELYKKQRNKITVDLKKFRTNQMQLAALFGTTRISRWMLVVPEFRGPRIVAHGQAKAAEVLAAGLPYVAATFEVGVITDDHFAVARQQLAGSGLTQVTAPRPAATSTVATWGALNSPLLNTLIAKATKLPRLTDPGARDHFVAKMVESYERGQFALEHLRSTYPDIFERLVECKNARQYYMEMDCLAMPMPGGELIQRELGELRKEISSALPNVAATTISDLVAEAVADWLMRCPLDFPALS